MDEAAALQYISSKDELLARRSFDSLHPKGLRFISNYLRQRFDADSDIIADIGQHVFVGLWSRRHLFQNRGVAAWYSLLGRSAHNRYIDFIRENNTSKIDDGVEVDSDRLFTLSHNEETLFADLVSDQSREEQIRRLYYYADIVFLKLDATISQNLLATQLLAAKLFFLDGYTWKQVLALLPVDAETGALYGQQTLDIWFAQPGLIRNLIFDSIYFTNERLAAHLLGVLGDQTSSKHETRGKLDELMNAAQSNLLSKDSDALILHKSAGCGEIEPPGGWTWEEVLLILRRYRYGLKEAKVFDNASEFSGRENLLELNVKCRSLYPFNMQMMALHTRLELFPEPERVFKHNGLWQRIAFQYYYHDQLRTDDILERTVPAAQHVEYDITKSMLHGWLSNGRLLDRLLTFYNANKERDL